MNQENKLFTKFRFSKPLILNGFSQLYTGHKSLDPNTVEQLQLNDLSYQDNYDIFKERVKRSIGKNHLPIYRMADGEFGFCLQFFDDNKRLSFTQSIRKLISNIKHLLIPGNYYYRKRVTNYKDRFKNMFDLKYYCVSQGECYSSRDAKEVKSKYIYELKKMAENGIIPLHFTKENGELIYEDSVKGICNWFKENDILINESNYTAFYNVYALMNGPDRDILFKDKNILIVTNASDEKQRSIKNNLKRLKIKSIQFYPISANKSMFDKIDVNKITQPVDVVFIAAGIGSLNIISQLESLNTVCIDAGIAIESMAYPDLKKQRLFLIDDEDLKKLDIKKSY